MPGLLQAGKGSAPSPGTEGKLALIVEANAKKAGAMRVAVDAKERARAEGARWRGLQEDARGPAVRAADTTGSPVLPRPEWTGGCPCIFCQPDRRGCLSRPPLCLSRPSRPCRPLPCCCPPCCSSCSPLSYSGYHSCCSCYDPGRSIACRRGVVVRRDCHPFCRLSCSYIDSFLPRRGSCLAEDET